MSKSYQDWCVDTLTVWLSYLESPNVIKGNLNGALK